ncbi:methylated-DNA--[protein]-cysteine S-methyltransferase [uncultured Methanoregula sp.]|uniref:methylated-DNA--[protein]-cysteine S-methyltransferase n=1 Tax=uncultured Methanoregula sp. TaxID=1005933 RepID=UPI0037486F00
MMSGSCRLGLWYVHVHWCGDTIHRVRFAREGIPGSVPEPVRQYCAGRPVDLTALNAVALHDDGTYSRIYQEVRKVPYGQTSSYGEIALRAGTGPRVVGQAMARNPAPLVIPCHRIVAARGIGGFSPSVEIKEMLLVLEQKGLRKILLSKKI